MTDENKDRVFIRKTTGKTYTFLGEQEVQIKSQSVMCVFYERNNRLFIAPKDHFYRAFKEVMK